MTKDWRKPINPTELSLPTPPSVPHLLELINHLIQIDRLDDLTCAHLTAALVAPKGSFVTIAPMSKEIRVCVGLKTGSGADAVWTDWPAWRLRWVAGELDAAFGCVERHLPGVNYLYGRGRENVDEPPYACRLLFGMTERLGQAEHNDGAVSVVLALLNALLKRAESAPITERKN